jgi:hypothetical protein
MQNDWHPIVDVGQERIWRSQDSATLDYIALRVSPSVPQAGEREQLAVVHLETVGLLRLAVSHPLVEPVSRNQAALRLEGLPERGSRGDRFGSGIDCLVSDARVLRPGWILLANPEPLSFCPQSKHRIH